MKTLKEKLNLVPSPIREMIEDEIRECPSGVDPKECDMLYESFRFNLEYFDFWDAVHLDLEHHVEQYNKKRKKMNNALIDQLKALNPTEGRWDSNGFNKIYSNRTYVAQALSGDDCELITIAPQMRTAILEMAKEIEELKSYIRTIQELNQ